MAGLNSKLIDSLRKYILDTKEFNQLNLNEEELNAQILEEAIQDGALAYDLILPLSTTDLAAITVPESDRIWYFVKRMAAIEAFERLVFLHTRNRNPSNDSGFKVDEYSKGADWNAIKEGLVNRYEEKARNYKRAVNLEAFNTGAAIYDTLELY